MNSSWNQNWFKHILFRHQQGKPYTKALKKCIYTIMCVCRYITIESELFSHGPARREAEPVFVAAESEMFTPVFSGGGGGGGRC